MESSGAGIRAPCDADGNNIEARQLTAREGGPGGVPDAGDPHERSRIADSDEGHSGEGPAWGQKGTPRTGRDEPLRSWARQVRRPI